MRTWYDTGTKQWLTQDANGQTRAATHAEALLYISNGGQAPAGVPLPALPATPANASVQTKTLHYDAASGSYWIDDPSSPDGKRAISGEQATTYAGQGWTIDSPSTVGAKNPDGSPIGGGNPPAPGGGTSTPAIPTGWGNTPVTTNYGWGTGFRGSTAGAQSPFANLTGTQQAYYQQNPDQANSLLRQWLAPNPNSAFAQFINARQGDLTTQFAAASTKPGNESLQYTDWLKQNFGQLSDQFAGQSATQRGQDPAQFGGGFAGRAAFS